VKNYKYDLQPITNNYLFKSMIRVFIFHGSNYNSVNALDCIGNRVYDYINIKMYKFSILSVAFPNNKNK
jgi:hypothetical protein